MFPSCSDLIRSLNTSLVILYTNLITNCCLLFHIINLVLNVICITVQQFPAFIFWKIILFAPIFFVYTSSNIQISTLNSTALKRKKTVLFKLHSSYRKALHIQ